MPDPNDAAAQAGHDPEGGPIQPDLARSIRQDAQDILVDPWGTGRTTE